jgi:hypothetical protein
MTGAFATDLRYALGRGTWLAGLGIAVGVAGAPCERPESTRSRR